MNFEIKNFVGIFDDNSIDDFCDLVIASFEDAHRNKITINRQQENKDVPSTTKDDTLTHFELLPNGTELADKFYSMFWDVWYKKYAEKYGVLRDSGWHSADGFKIQKTEPGQGYHVWHYEADSMDMSTRLLTWILYLNDVDEGGETEFLYLHSRIKPKKGRLIVWPAGFTHTHRGNPPLSGSKYIATGWITFQQKT